MLDMSIMMRTSTNYFSPVTMKRPSGRPTPRRYALPRLVGRSATDCQEMPPSFCRVSVEVRNRSLLVFPPVMM